MSLVYEHHSSPCLGSEAIHLRIKYCPLIKTLTLTLPLLNLLSLLWGSVHQLKFVEVDPGITKVWIKFHRPGVEKSFIKNISRKPSSPCHPVPAFLDLAITPEEPGNGEEDVGIVLALLHRVNAPCFSLRLRLHLNC